MELLLTPWRNKLLNLVRDTREELFIIAPYVGPSIIEDIIENFRGKRIRILTKVDAHDFSGRLNLRSFELFRENNPEIDVQIRLIRNLHAKVLVFDNKKGIITSSNLTQAGVTTNIELGILITDENYIKEQILPILEYYWSQGEVLSREDADEIAKEVEKIKNTYSLMPELENVSSMFPGIFGTRVLPIGKDETPKKPSKKKIAKEIALKLMEKELTKDEILEILESFGNPKKTILLDAFEYSFDSDSPFETAGIYYRNMLKVLPRFQREFSKTKAKMFCNMILGRGKLSKYGIEIENLLDYWKYQSMFASAFNMKPPKSEKVLQAMEHRLDKILSDPIYITRIIRIFLPLAAANKNTSIELKKLLELLLDNIHQEKQKMDSKKKEYKKMEADPLQRYSIIEKEIKEALEQLEQMISR